MHELSLADDLVGKCRQLAAGREVVQIWLRCSASTDRQELTEAFRAAALATAAPAATRPEMTSNDAENLSSARLVFELAPSTLACACGFEGELAESSIAGHMAVCPHCGKVSSVGPGLELVGLVLGAAPPKLQAR
jgi:Zn finger protein HypA/HybF involved in hydrogenase expression